MGPWLGVIMAGIGFLAFSGVAAAQSTPAAITLTATPVPLDYQDTDRRTFDALTYVAGFELTSDHADFGGLSGMLVSLDGGTLLAVTDQGKLLTLALAQDESGVLTGVGAAQLKPLTDEKGKPFSDKKWSDAEGLTRSKNGYAVSFERVHRLLQYDADFSKSSTIRIPKATSFAPKNGGMEALATLPDGRFFILTEESGETVSQGWIGGKGQWETFTYPRMDDFKPTGATALPNGDILLVERYFTPVFGPGTRIRRIASSAIKADAEVTGDLLMTLRPPLLVDNMEAIDALPAPGGGLFIYILSDDNFNAVQKTLLLQFRLADPG
ncbi:MAG: esterase-like activity of phytase family protein [Magnetospiraceae bacterium]